MSPFPYTREEAVAQYIGQFPSEYLLQRAQTKDQQDYWGHLAAFYLMVSLCWQARLKGNDPFIEAVENQTMNQWHYDAIWSRVELLQSLWKLIESGHQSISEAVINAGHNYPFIGAPDLFCHIVETHANNTFRICFKPYHNISNPARLKAWKILRRAAPTGTISPQNCNLIKNLASQYNGNSWLLLSLAVICDVAAPGNREILEKLANLFEAAQQDMEVSVTGLSRKRSSKNFEKFCSFTWHHGKIIPANKTGGTYSL
jgi:hypothetical protein